jgi:hypothetical protein
MDDHALQRHDEFEKMKMVPNEFDDGEYDRQCKGQGGYDEEIEKEVQDETSEISRASGEG